MLRCSHNCMSPACPIPPNPNCLFCCLLPALLLTAATPISSPPHTANTCSPYLYLPVYLTLLLCLAPAYFCPACLLCLSCLLSWVNSLSSCPLRLLSGWWRVGIISRKHGKASAIAAWQQISAWRSKIMAQRIIAPASYQRIAYRVS